MFKTQGLFDNFDNLDQIDPVNLARWVKPTPQIAVLENFLGNKILYPQTTSITSTDIQIELAMLREVIRLNLFSQKASEKELLGNNPFFNFTLRKVIIPAKFLDYIPSLGLLAWAFLDVLSLAIQKKDWFEDLWTVVLTSDVDEVVGSIILPQFEKNGTYIEIFVLGKTYKIKKGGLTIIPCLKEKSEIYYKLDKGKFLGKDSSAVEISGGKLGIVVDTRRI